MALEWRKSSYSKDWNQALCVEVAAAPSGGQFVRDSKNPAGHVLQIAASDWAGFMRRIKTGERLGGQ